MGFRALGDVLLVGGVLRRVKRTGDAPESTTTDDAVLALGQVCHLGAALISGSVALLDVDNVYAAAALNRQLVEVEYLAYALADDRDEAADWLRSSKEQRLARWQPRHLRERSQGRFRGRDYAHHCELGGHPTPAGAGLVLKVRASTAAGRALTGMQWFETVSHGLSAWCYVRSTYVGSVLAPEDRATAVDAAEAQWRERDQLVAVCRQGQV